MPTFGRGRGGYVAGSTPQPGAGNWPNKANQAKAAGRSDVATKTPLDDGSWAQAWLEQLLEGYEPLLKKTALQNFAEEGERSSKFASEISSALEDEEAEVRKAAAYTLGKIGPASGKAAANSLASVLRDEDKGVRAETAKALGLLGREAAGSHAAKIAGLATDMDESAAGNAVEALALLGEAGLMGPFFSSKFAQVRRMAIVEVARSPHARVALASSIAARISDKETTVRLAAVQASGDLGSMITDEHLGLLGALRAKEQHVKVRKTAVQALGKIGEKGISNCVEFFRDSDEGVRHSAGETLGGIIGGQNAGIAAERSLEERDPLVRCAALLALGKLGECGLAFSKRVAEHLEDSSFPARLAAIQALSDLGAGTEAANLGDLAEDGSKGVRQASVSALAKMGADGAANAVRFFADEEQAVRCAAIRVYSPLHSKLPERFARPYARNVAAMLDDEDWRVRFEAAKALGDLHAGEFAPQVGALWQYTGGSIEDNQVKRTAIQALTKMGQENAHYLLPFLDDEDRRVRDEAAREVATLGGVELLKVQAAEAAAVAIKPSAVPAGQDEEEEVLSEPD